jgi:glycosyltransferase involved in cell wall biosynthesis
MQSGTPVVVSDRGSLPEVVEDAGVVVDPTDEPNLSEALEMLLTDDFAYRMYRCRGLDHAANFSWDRTARNVRTVFEQKLPRGES